MADGTLLKPDSEEKQRFTRSSIICDGCLQAGGRTIACKIFDISAGGAKLETEEPLTDDADLVLQIADLVAFPAKVAWQRDGQIGIEFAVAPDTVSQVLPEILHGPAKVRDKRDHLRSAVLWSGEVIHGDRIFPCRILNVSSGGAKVRFDGEIPDGAEIRISCSRFVEMPARVVWCKGGKMGLEFLDDPRRVLQFLGSALTPVRDD